MKKTLGCCLLSVALLAGLVGCRDTPSEEEVFGAERAAEPAKTEPAAKTEATSDKAASANKEVTPDGYEVIRAQTKQGENVQVEVKPPEGWKVAQKPTPDPRGGKFTLKDALKDMPAKGSLVATIRTSLGTLDCELFEDKAPITVANFVGLARGLREIWSGKDGAWVAKPYYDGTTFHRVIPGFMIQGGDFAGDGSGEIFYTIPDEIHPSLKHDHAGQLCMANRGPNTNAAQFFITDAAAPHLDGGYTIFGQCEPTSVVSRIARVPQSGSNNRPLTPVVIERVTVERRSGAAKPAAASGDAKPAAPGQIPPGTAVEEKPAKTGH